MPIFIIAIFSILSTFAQKGSDLIDISIKNFDQSDHVEILTRFKHSPGWHTYWKNPGDSGLPIEFEYKISDTTVSFTELEWPAPERHIEEGDIWTYGYEGQVDFIHKIKKSDLKNGKTLSYNLKWLICKDLCIPGKKSFNAIIKDQKLSWIDAKEAPVSENQLIKIREDRPSLLVDHGLELDLTLHKKNEFFALDFKSKKFESIKGKAFLIPFPTPLALFKHPKFSDSKTGRILLEWTGQYNEPEIPFPIDNKFQTPFKVSFLVKSDEGKAFIVRKEFNTLGKKKNLLLKSSIEESAPTSIWITLFFAFIGGLILNFMPCVLPVISIKLFGLIKNKENTRSQIIKHNLLYSLGVLATLLSLGLVIIFLKNSGEVVGWGFQLQSPYFLSIMIVVIFTMALNFFGLFEFGTPGGKSLANLNFKNSGINDFFSGVLATILSTPCSAPFLGTALTFALTTNNFNIILTFTFIALGLSSPFLLTMIFPKMLNVLPRPGAWMEKFKYILGLSLAFTALWLLDIFSAITNPSATFYFLGLLIFIFFSIFSFKKISKSKVLIFLNVLALAYFACHTYQSLNEKTDTNSLAQWNTWSTQTIQESLDKEETIFIDFTAKWCLTCQINKAAVLNTKAFSDYARDNNIKLYRADWTKKDKDITLFLERNKLVGIPAYFLLKDGKLNYLGETISIGKMEKYFETN